MTARYSAEVLRHFVRNCYEKLGVPTANAALVADTLVQADLWGHQSHGVMRTFWYGARFETGATNPSAQTSWVADAGALALLDGHDGIGQVVARQAMQGAIERAAKHGIGAVSIRNSGHFGTAMYFTRMAAEAGCIGLLSTNASPAMAPWGGREKRVGNNPWSIAAPAGKYPPVMLDIANTVVARGKLYLARQRGEAIPDGWAIDADGAPTADPALGIAGNILPMAGHKGYAIAVMMDVLSGVLGGSGFGEMIGGPYQSDRRSRVGHLAIAIDIASCRPLAEFKADIDAMIDRLKSTPKAPGVEEIYYPGEIEARTAEENMRLGIELPADTVADLNTQARRLGAELLD